MNAYMGKLGLNIAQYSFHDVLSTEDWALEMVPRPVLGVLMLFPINEASEQHRDEERVCIENNGQILSDQLFYTKQTIGNACGTIGLLHAVGNARSSFLADAISDESYLFHFFQATANMNPEAIATYLESDEALEETHTSAATEGQSESVDDVDNHFICFSHVDGNLYELG